MRISIYRLDQSGHTTLAQLDLDDAEAVAGAERILAQARAHGSVPFVLDNLGHGRQITSLTEATGDVYLAPHLVGG